MNPHNPRDCQARNKFTCRVHGTIQLPQRYDADYSHVENAIRYAGMDRATREMIGLSQEEVAGLTPDGVYTDSTALTLLEREGADLYGIDSELFRFGMEAQMNPNLFIHELDNHLRAFQADPGVKAGDGKALHKVVVTEQLSRWYDTVQARVTEARKFYTDNPDYYVTDGPMPVPDEAGRTEKYPVPVIQAMPLPDLSNPENVDKLLNDYKEQKPQPKILGRDQFKNWFRGQ